MTETPEDFDRQLREWLEPSGVEVERVRHGAMCGRTRTRTPVFLVLAGGLVVLMCLAVGSLTVMRPSPAPAGSVDFSIETTGQRIAVRAEGHTWVVLSDSTTAALPEGSSSLILYGENP